MKLERTVETTTAPDVVYAYLSDFTNTVEWDPGSVATELVDGDGGVGSTYHNVSEFNGRKTELTYTVVRLEEPSLVELRGENKTVTAVDTMRIEPAGSGSRVHYTADFTFKGVAALAQPFLGRAFKRLGDEAQAGLQEALDRL